MRADNATDALTLLRRGDKIDLVFSDVVMPGGMNGIALAQEIANHYPQIPVLLTAVIATSHKQRASRSCASPFSCRY